MISVNVEKILSIDLIEPTLANLPAVYFLRKINIMIIMNRSIILYYIKFLYLFLCITFHF